MAPLVNFSGLASGIDSNSLIQAILDRDRSVRINPLQEKISAYQDTNSAFDELTTLLQKLQSVATKYREVSGGGLAKQAGSSDETILTATTANSASNATYSITTSQLAQNANFSFNDRFAASSSVINSSINNGAAEANRTVTVTTGTGAEQESVNIVLTNTSTAQSFVDDFNSSSDKAEASLVNVGTSASPSYAISIRSIYSGTEQGETSVNVGSEIQSAGSGAFTANTLSQATNASFSVTGISGTISRSTNDINDVISGVNLKLVSTGSATITIGDDVETSVSTMQELVDAYNEVVSFIKENDLITREEDGSDVRNIFGPLASTSLDENVLSILRQSLTGSSISGQSINTLADLGISTNRDGSLSLNEDAFKNALSTDPESVRTITQNLGDRLGAVDGTIAQFTRFGGLIDQSTTANASQIKSLENKISDIENFLLGQERSMIAQYARLESVIGSLNSQQNALSALLPR